MNSQINDVSGGAGSQEEQIEHSNVSFKFAPIIYFCASIQFWFACYYDWNYAKYPPHVMKESFGGKLKYLTFWDALVQALYFTLCVLNHFIGSDEVNPKEKPLIRRFKDYLYATVAFPVAMFVGVTFWILMAIDRELVLPKALDPYFPWWLNHMMHTNIMFFTLLEMFMSFRSYPPRSKGLTGLLTFMLIYLIWVHIIYAKSSVWVYPLLEVLNLWQRIGFFASTLILVLSLYFVGEFLNQKAWGKLHRQLEGTKGRRKTK